MGAAAMGGLATGLDDSAKTAAEPKIAKQPIQNNRIRKDFSTVKPPQRIKPNTLAEQEQERDSRPLSRLAVRGRMKHLLHS